MLASLGHLHVSSKFDPIWSRSWGNRRCLWSWNGFGLESRRCQAREILLFQFPPPVLQGPNLIFANLVQTPNPSKPINCVKPREHFQHNMNSWLRMPEVSRSIQKYPEVSRRPQAKYNELSAGCDQQLLWAFDHLFDLVQRSANWAFDQLDGGEFGRHDVFRAPNHWSCRMLSASLCPSHNMSRGTIGDLWHKRTYCIILHIYIYMILYMYIYDMILYIYNIV